jgi:HTH-type transcriptional regulator/antitoxin HigA
MNKKELKYKIIKSEAQYQQYCNLLEELILKDENKEDEIELLTFLIEKWDNENVSFGDADPIEIIKFLMKENNLRSKDLVEILGLSKGTISKILNYQKGLSKNTILKLSEYFKVSQETFNRPYQLTQNVKSNYKKTRLSKSGQKTVGA